MQRGRGSAGTRWARPHAQQHKQPSDTLLVKREVLGGERRRIKLHHMGNRRTGTLEQRRIIDDGRVARRKRDLVGTAGRDTGVLQAGAHAVARRVEQLVGIHA